MSTDDENTDRTKVHSISQILGGPAQQQAASFLIVIHSRIPASLGKMLKLEVPEVFLGRSPECQIQLEDEGVSRKHAKLVRQPLGGYDVVDLNSTNGTFHNGVRVSQAPLLDGDKIQLGSKLVLKYSLQDSMEEEYQRSIYDSATRDALTKAFNKKYFIETLKKEFAYCQRHKRPLSVVMFDIDHFKKVNDTWGHLAGDHVLSQLGQVVATTIRTEDTFARYGGEEFALILRDIGEEAGLRCAERCREAVEKTVFEFSGNRIPVTISLGVATMSAGELSEPDELIHIADSYLYRAKQGGRNRVDAPKISGP